VSFVQRAFWELLSLEYPLLRRDFSSIYEKVRATPVYGPRSGAPGSEQVCLAVDTAAAFYFKKILCLQRSAATVCLLKKCGFAAEMVIGVQQMPFLAHAWVELDGLVINDKPYVAENYLVLARC
jgi:transglutaminase superfamily protein